MKKIINQEKINELLTRGVENIYPTANFLESALQSGRRLTLYTGYDATAPTLHIGHGLTLLKLRQFQDLGHRVIMLIGDFTGMIGDPTDKTTARQKLTHQQVLENCKLYQAQAATILDFSGQNPVELKFNSEWHTKLSFAEVLELCTHFTVQQMLERDMFKKRFYGESPKPIYLHEFMYPLLQAYDSVAMDVDGEVGGNDQTFNMLRGRDLIKDLKQKEKFVVSLKLLTDDGGKKMGKTEGNMIAFTDTPADMFGKVMRFTDSMIIGAFELCTRVPMKEIRQLAESMKRGANPRDLKLRLAYEITSTFLGEAAARQGQEHFASVIQEHNQPGEIPELKPSAYDIATILVEAGICKSKGEARRAIEQGGVKINERKIDSSDAIVKANDVVQKGKRFFVKVV